MSYQEFLEDKLHKLKHTYYGQSDCCSSPIIENYELCSECYDSCYNVDNTCGYCGDEVDENEKFCSEGCKRGYEYETYKKD